MILSNREIQKAIDQGLLVIRPEPTPRDPSAASPVPCPYDTTSVDLRLGRVLSVPVPGSFTYDPRMPGLASFLGRNCNHVTIDPQGGFALRPDAFVLGSTWRKSNFH